MTQNKTTIKSGNNTLKGYDLDGIVTPASGLKEWLIYSVDVMSVGGDTLTLNLNKLPHPIYLVSIILRLNDTPQNNDYISISQKHEGLGGLELAKVELNETQRCYCIKFNQPISPEDNLFFANVTQIDYVELRGYRIALHQIETALKVK